ncbi:flavin reductase family protein [Sabulicella glaciei]|uniref:Flavin reductase family protein n=1 Tax=Sabulicella glaciei TaxID=2984948 RepID=A0ABT3NRF2_9PROT|nr:flavin reductase family protein [Roseococcus sp. MDT2-1-1]MCW8084745.1 flavin reductase family protein [Roseococcus sp. MDT2-1-1]
MYFDFEALPAADRYKLVVSTVVPRPVAWVVSQDEAGVLNAAPYSFFNALTDDPVVIAIGCGPRPDGARKDTLGNIRATGQFVVNLVNEATVERMNITAIDFGPDVNELEEAGLTTIPSSKVKPPRIAESPVALECKTFQLITVGHHTIVLGQVLAMHIADEAMLDVEKKYVDTPKLGLVGRMHGRGWYARTTDRVEVPRIALKDWQSRKGD